MDDCFIPLPSPPDLDERAVAGFGTAGEGCSHGVPRRTLRSPNRTVPVPPRRLSPPLDPLPMSQAGWISKDRSTPEGINMEEHAWRFRFSMPRPKWTSKFDPASVRIPVVMQKKKPPEVRNALRERRVAAKQKDARYHAEVALRKYNRANNTNFELVEVTVISIFSEFGGAGAHYNFTAKQPEDQHSVDADCTKLFFSEVNLHFRSENDVIMCCIVGENDAGHCYGCENYQPVVHPSSQAGGSSTCIDYPRSDGDSDSTDSDD